MVSRSVLYTWHILCFLAEKKQNQTCSIDEIRSLVALPDRFVYHLLDRLSEREIIRLSDDTVLLIRPSKSISFMDVIYALEENIFPTHGIEYLEPKLAQKLDPIFQETESLVYGKFAELTLDQMWIIDENKD